MAEKARRTGPCFANKTERVRQADIGRQPLAGRFEIFADRPHARRQVLVVQLLRARRRLVTGETRNLVVTAGPMMHGPRDRRAVHPPRHLRQVFADVNPGNVRGNRVEFAAGFNRRQSGFISNISCVGTPPCR